MKQLAELDCVENESRNKQIHMFTNLQLIIPCLALFWLQKGRKQKEALFRACSAIIATKRGKMSNSLHHFKQHKVLHEEHINVKKGTTNTAQKIFNMLDSPEVLFHF